MTELVTVKVKAGQSLAAPDGRMISAGEIMEVPRHEAEFFERMGAAEIVVSDPAADKPTKRGKNSSHRE